MLILEAMETPSMKTTDSSNIAISSSRSSDRIQTNIFVVNQQAEIYSSRGAASGKGGAHV